MIVDELVTNIRNECEYIRYSCRPLSDRTVLSCCQRVLCEPAITKPNASQLKFTEVSRSRLSTVITTFCGEAYRSHYYLMLTVHVP